MQEDGTERYDDVAMPRTSLPEVCLPDDSLRCALLELTNLYMAEVKLTRASTAVTAPTVCTLRVYN